MAVSQRRPRFRYTRPWLYEKQLRAFFNDKRIAVCEAATKIGKTFACIVWLLEQAIVRGGPGREFWWVAPFHPTAEIAYLRFKRYLARAACRSNDTDRTITLPNGSILKFRSGEKPDTLYGEDVWAAVIDEGSRLREAAWVAIRSAVTGTRGFIRVIGNVKGRENWMFKLARRAQKGDEPDLHYEKITAWDAVEAGVMLREAVEEARRDLSETSFNQLFLAEAPPDAGNPFGYDVIQRNLQASLAPGPVFWWGWDLAKSLNWTVGIGLNEAGLTAAYHRFQKPWAETLGFIRRTVGNTPALADASGVGDPIVEFLQRASTPLEAQPLEKPLSEWKLDGCTGLLGYKFSRTSKQQLLEMYTAGLQLDQIGLYPGDREEVVLEHEAFEYEYTRTGVLYSAPQGCDDDTVMAYALAAHSKRTAFLTRNMGGALVAM